MAKASEFVRSALLKITAVGSQQPVEAIDAQDVLTELNDMLIEWDGSGVSLGFTTLTDLGDEVTIPGYSNSAVKNNLAVRVAAEYGRTVQPSTVKTAGESYDNLLIAIISVDPVIFPSTLPVGSGNECGNGSWDYKFYPGPEEGTTITETGGSILTETDTE